MSWAEHSAAAAEMGVDQRTAYETYDDGWPALARASRDRNRAVEASLEEADNGGPPVCRRPPAARR